MFEMLFISKQTKRLHQLKVVLKYFVYIASLRDFVFTAFAFSINCGKVYSCHRSWCRCLHATGSSSIPIQLYPGSILSSYIRLYDAN